MSLALASYIQAVNFLSLMHAFARGMFFGPGVLFVAHPCYFHSEQLDLEVEDPALVNCHWCVRNRVELDPPSDQLSAIHQWRPSHQSRGLGPPAKGLPSGAHSSGSPPVSRPRFETRLPHTTTRPPAVWRKVELYPPCADLHGAPARPTGVSTGPSFMMRCRGPRDGGQLGPLPSQSPSYGRRKAFGGVVATV